MKSHAPFGRLVAAAAVAASLALATACGPAKIQTPASGEQGADKFLFDRGNEAFGKKHWIEAREYYTRLVDTYPQSPYRQDAKLGIGDAYLGENRVESDILAANEFKEFLQFFPLAPRADYAQYRLAVTQMHQMLGPERDQTETQAALKELDTFVRNYPSSKYMPDVQKLLRQVHDRLSTYDYLVGVQYFRLKYYPGAILRLQGILTNDPQYTDRDAVYYYLGESYYRSGRKAEALPYFDKLVQEFKVSKYLKDANARLAELKH